MNKAEISEVAEIIEDDLKSLTKIEIARLFAHIKAYKPKSRQEIGVKKILNHYLSKYVIITL